MSLVVGVTSLRTYIHILVREGVMENLKNLKKIDLNIKNKM